MAQRNCTGYILGSQKSGEQNKILIILTKQGEIIHCIAPGSCKAKNRFGATLEMFNYCDFILYQKENSYYATINKAFLLKGYFHETTRDMNIFYLNLIAEITLKLIPLNFKEERIFRLIDNILKSLNKKDIISLTIYFIIWFLKIEGLLFSLNKCSNCNSKIINIAYLREDYRGLLCRICQNNEEIFFLKEELNFIKSFANTHPSNIKGDEVKRLQNLLLKIIQIVQYHAEETLKSFKILKQITN